MSQTSFDFVSANGLFKTIYADKMKDLLPDGVKLVKEVDFVPQAERHGASYNQALCLGMEHGFTYGGSQGQAFSLNGAIAGNVLQAEVRGHEMVLESVISTAAITRSENKEGAFVQATKHVVKNMFFSMNKRLETQCFYGQSGLAVIDSADPVTASVVITDAGWAPGVWSGANKMKVEIRTANGATSRGVAQVKRVDLSTRTITFDALPAGTSATDVLWYEGS